MERKLTCAEVEAMTQSQREECVYIKVKDDWSQRMKLIQKLGVGRLCSRAGTKTGCSSIIFATKYMRQRCPPCLVSVQNSP